jgi:hypothetical protein
MKLNEIINSNQNLNEHFKEEINQNTLKDDDSKLIKNRFENSRNFILKDYFFSNCQKKFDSENSDCETSNISQSNKNYSSMSNLLLS